jgi:hypothetical protein
MGRKNEMYNEIIRLKKENEKMREMLEQFTQGTSSASASNPADTSKIDDAEFSDVDNNSQTSDAMDEKSERILNLAKKYAAQMNLNDEDIAEMKAELAKATDAQKEKYASMLEAKLVHQRASSRLADIVQMELSGKKPKEILTNLHRNDETDENKFVDKLAAKLRSNEMSFANFGSASSLFW